MKLWEGNAFTHVCLPVDREGVPYDHYPWCIRPHGYKPPPPPPRPQPSTLWILDIGNPLPAPVPLVMTSDGVQDWRPVQTCSLENLSTDDIWWSRLEIYSNLLTWGLPPPPPSWHLVAIEVASTVRANGWYTFCWNAFLLCWIFIVAFKNNTQTYNLWCIATLLVTILLLWVILM